METLETKNQITIKQSALFFLDEPIERCVEDLVANNEKDNGENYTFDEIREIDSNTECIFQKRGRGGNYTFTIKTEMEKIILSRIISSQLEYVEMLCEFGEERASKSMELYLSEKVKECYDLEINRGEKNF